MKKGGMKNAYDIRERHTVMKKTLDGA